MTQIYLDCAKKFMNEGKFSYAETALRKALGAANREKIATGNIFRALNHLRGVL